MLVDMSINPVINNVALTTRNQSTISSTSSTTSNRIWDPSENVNQDIVGSTDSTTDVSVAEKQLQYFRSLKLDLLCDWDEEYRKLAEIDDDKCIEIRLKYYHKFVHFMLDDRVLYLTFFFELYYIIAYGILQMLYPEYYYKSSSVFYFTHLVIFAFSLVCIKAVKGKIFGDIVSKTKDTTNIGYYKLLNMKYKYMEKQQTVRTRRGSIGIISSNFGDDSGFESYKSSSKIHWALMFLVFFNFTANFTLFVIIVCNYNKEKHTPLVYYHYLFLFGLIDSYTRIMCVNHLIIILISMIYASSATQRLCFNWIQRLDKYRKISMSRYNLLVHKQMESNKNDKDALPTVGQIQLDLFERYLFIVGALVYTSRIFNNATAIISGASVLFFMIFAYLLYSTEDIVYLSFMFYLCIAFFGTIGCMSYANTSIGRIMDVLKMSVPTLKVGNNDDQDIASDSYLSSSKLVLKDLGNTDINRTSDFELIGGRDYWINYINEVPGKYHFMKNTIFMFLN